MAIRTEQFETDPLSRAVPGQSFTDIPGKNPYEHPAMTSSPKEAFEIIMSSLEEPESYETILNLLDAGLSSETIASALLLKMFAEGVLTPDVAEIIKPSLVAHITQLGLDAGIEDINVINQIPSSPVNSEDTLKLMRKISPEKFNKKINEFSRDEQDELLSAHIELPEEEDQEVPRESFLDMEIE